LLLSSALSTEAAGGGSPSASILAAVMSKWLTLLVPKALAEETDYYKTSTGN